MTRICLAILLVCICQAGDAIDPKPEAKLPAAAQAALDRYARAEAKLQADLAKALSAERQKTIVELEKAQKIATRAGDLDAALAVKAQIEALQKIDAAEAQALLGDAVPAKADLARQVLGNWALIKSFGPGMPCEIHEGGSMIVHIGQIMLPGHWRIDKNRVQIVWANDESKWENLAFDGPDRMTGDSFDAGKGGVQFIRQRPAGETPRK